MPKAQNLANHGKIDPVFHYFVLPVISISALLAIWELVRNPSFTSAWLMIFAFALVGLSFKTRLNALKVQDRVIRLEERLRLAILLPEPLRSRIHDLTEAQLIALRFAPDEEIPGLVARTLSNKLVPADIKKAIVNWRPDYFRV
jgi:hypothetical protein